MNKQKIKNLLYLSEEYCLNKDNNISIEELYFEYNSKGIFQVISEKNEIINIKKKKKNQNERYYQEEEQQQEEIEEQVEQDKQYQQKQFKFERLKEENDSLEESIYNLINEESKNEDKRNNETIEVIDMSINDDNNDNDDRHNDEEMKEEMEIVEEKHLKDEELEIQLQEIQEIEQIEQREQREERNDIELEIDKVENHEDIHLQEQQNQIIQENQQDKEKEEKEEEKIIEVKDYVDLNSFAFNPSKWPGDAKIRSSFYHRYDNGHNQIEKKNSKVIYIPTIAHRIEGNVALSMAMWFADSLQIDLEILTFIENSTYSTVLADDFIDHTAHRKAITRVTSLSCMKSYLKEVLDIELQAFYLMKEQTLSEAIIDWYTNEVCLNCLSNINNENDNYNDNHVNNNNNTHLMKKKTELDPLNLFIITDDGIHPHINEMINSLIKSIQSSFGVNKKCKCCDEEKISQAIIQFVISFDNISIVPSQNLYNEVISSLDYSPTDSEMITLLLTRLSSQFDGCCFSTQSLLSPNGLSQEIQKKWIQNKQKLFTNSRKHKKKHKHEFDWLEISNAILRYNTAFLTSEVNTFVGCTLLQCTRSSLIDFLTYNLNLLNNQSTSLSTSPSSSSSNSSSSQKLPISNFWDIYCCWGTISPLEISFLCRQLSTYDLTIWNFLFRPQLLHMESCRLVFLFKSPSIISKNKKLSSSSSSQSSSFNLRIQQLLSEKCHNLLKLCNGTSSINIIRPESLINGKTGDKIFDKIQNKFKINGIIPNGSSGAYWICFLLIYSSTGHSALQLATVEIARNCLCFIEYNSWPLTYLASLIESLSNIIIIPNNSPSSSSSSSSLLTSDQIYQRLQEYLNQISI